MEEEGENGVSKADNAVVIVRPKQGIKRRGLRALWAAILLQFGIRLSKKPPAAVPTEEKEKENYKEDAIRTSESGDHKNETTWKDIVGGMRPLHYLQPFQPPYFISMPPPPPPPPFFDNEIYHDVSMPPSSPRSVSDGMSSRYCSAEDLQILDKSNNDDIVPADDNEEGGSDVINTQADEFIANFYEQIRLQRLKSLDESYPQTARSRMVINC